MTAQRSSSEPDESSGEHGTELRGFALYVGISESRARDEGTAVIDVVDALRDELGRRVPSAESHALAVVAPIGSDENARDLDVVMLALGKTAPERPASETSAASADGAGVEIDLARHRVVVDNEDARLTYRELALLQALVRNSGNILTRAQLRRSITSDSETEINDRTIDVHIRRMRVKLGRYPHLIRTAHGTGYRFDPRQDVTVL